MMFSALKELTITSWDEKKEISDTLMAFFRRTLTTVSNTHPEWIIPRVMVSTPSGEELGFVEKISAEEF